MRNKVVWQIRNLFLICKALAALARSGTRRRIPERVRTVAIVQGARLGDMVCTTPIFRALKHATHPYRIVVVGDAVNQKLLEDHPGVDHYIVWKKNFSAVARALRQEHVDFGIVPLPSLESLALLIVAGARAIAVPHVEGGISSFETRGYRLLRHFVLTLAHYWGGYAPREYLRLLEPLGIKTDDTKKWLTYSDAARERIMQFFTAHHLNPETELLIGITPSVGGNPRKKFAPQRFAGVADYLVEKYSANIIILGSGRDETDIKDMWRAMRAETRARAINTLNLFSLDEAKALIARLSLFISADTGPIYIAEAFGTPTIDIVGPMDENAQPPRGELHAVVVPPRDKPAFNLLNHDGSNPEEELRQANATTVEMVTKTIDELLEKIREQK